MRLYQTIVIGFVDCIGALLNILLKSANIFYRLRFSHHDTIDAESLRVRLGLKKYKPLDSNNR